ncbi:hypothetical protein FOZ61_011090 [Perkinsus olseni]|uniref:Uncharacterized protein n=2 Tax=Perkinsus olseni TaxID=32597 RepID=A0A7J6KX83_PEROL|nr:hypothetical protein FOZ61_011090 [Perkinsus olseni]KAF4651848.1 hypothetical protein FOL46_010017 [Perkinsus olseni]
MMRPPSSSPMSTQHLPYDPAAIAKQLKRTRQVLSVARKQADEALAGRDEALEEVRRLKREIETLKGGVENEMHKLRADLAIISSERDMMMAALTEVHSATGMLTERLEKTAGDEFYELFKWLWLCTGPDLERAALERRDPSKTRELIAGLVGAVSEAQSNKEELRRERQNTEDLRAEVDAARTKMEAMEKSESDARAQIAIKTEALKTAELNYQQAKEGLESAERRGVWLTGQVREMQSLVNEKDALVQKLQRGDSHVYTSNDEHRELEESVLSQYLPRKLNPSILQRSSTPEPEDATPARDPSPPSSILRKGSASRRVQMPDWGRKASSNQHDCSDVNLRSLQITASID